VCVSFSCFSVFLAILRVIQCCDLFHVCQFSRHNTGPRVWISHISRSSLFLVIFHVLQCVFLILHIFQCFLPYFMSYRVNFSISSFVSFLFINQVLQFNFLLFQIGQFSCHIPGLSLCVSHFARFSVFIAIFHVLPCGFSSSSFFSFLVINKFLECEFLIFLVCQFSRHIPGHTVFASHFPLLSIFLPQSRSDSVYFSYFTCFSVYHHISGTTVYVSHFAYFSVLLVIFHVLNEFLFFLVFQCFSPHFISYHVNFSFSSFVSFLAIFQGLQCDFLIFLVGQFFCHIPGPTVCISHFSPFFSVSRHLPVYTFFVSHFPRFSVFSL
jgi:hypothetical protein